MRTVGTTREFILANTSVVHKFVCMTGTSSDGVWTVAPPRPQPLSRNVTPSAKLRRLADDNLNPPTTTTPPYLHAAFTPRRPPQLTHLHSPFAANVPAEPNAFARPPPRRRAHLERCCDTPAQPQVPTVFPPNILADEERARRPRSEL